MINQRNWNETMFASSCWLVELSTPFLNHFKVHGSTVAGALFVVTFFVFRVLWLSKLSIAGWSNAVNRAENGLIIGFTALNYWWFMDILKTGWEMQRKNTSSSTSSSTQHQLSN